MHNHFDNILLNHSTTMGNCQQFGIEKLHLDVLPVGQVSLILLS